MNTKDIMDVAIGLAGLSEVPADSGIQLEGEDVKKILIGVDMETPEILLGRELGVDLVISHHPNSDSARINFHKVMDRQVDKMVEYGVPINKAQKVLAKRIEEVALGTHVSNYDRASSAARLLKMPFMNIHLPADIIGENIVQKHLDDYTASRPKATCGDIVEALKKIEVYRDAVAGPVIRVGSESSYAGKVIVLFAGGTNGGTDVFKAYFEAGVGTIVCMHVPDGVRKAVAEQNIGNVIVAGHMASDSIGLNKIIEALEDKGLEVQKMAGIL